MSVHKDSVRRMLFATLRKFKVGGNHVLPQTTFELEVVQHLSPPEADVLNEVLEDLVNEGILEQVEEGLVGWRLTAAGQDAVYP